jgi:cyclohexanone monooxygenase
MERIVNFNRVISGIPQDVDLVNDGWTEVLSRVGVEIAGVNDRDDARQQADFTYMESVRQRVDDIVKDKATAEALKPWFNIMCKRPCFHDQYLDTFNRPNVTLVDTDGRGVERISENAVWVDGKAYEVDCLIYASGFEFQTPDLARRNGFETYGRMGQSLTEKWAPGMRTLFGYFNQSPAQGAVTSNVTHGLGESARQFAFMVRYCRDNQVRSFEPREEAEHAWVEKLHAMAGMRDRYDAECTPSYYNNEGKPEEGAGLNSFYPGGSDEFLSMMHAWCDAGSFEGMDLSRA